MNAIMNIVIYTGTTHIYYITLSFACMLTLHPACDKQLSLLSVCKLLLEQHHLLSTTQNKMCIRLYEECVVQTALHVVVRDIQCTISIHSCYWGGFDVKVSSYFSFYYTECHNVIASHANCSNNKEIGID